MKRPVFIIQNNSTNTLQFKLYILFAPLSLLTKLFSLELMCLYLEVVQLFVIELET